MFSNLEIQSASCQPFPFFAVCNDILYCCGSNAKMSLNYIVKSLQKLCILSKILSKIQSCSLIHLYGLVISSSHLSTIQILQVAVKQHISCFAT